MAAQHWLGFDLGGTKMLAAVYDEKFETLGRKRRRTKAEEGLKNCVRRMVQAIDMALEDAGRTRADLAGLGVGCPGPVDLDHGVVVEAVNLGWEKVPLQQILEDEFRVPVRVLNDVDAGVYGENRFGAARGARTVVGVFPGTGVGGGCVYNGDILRGRNTSCMEIGHIQVVPDGQLCGCGRRGCLETEISRLAIAAQAAQAVYRGNAPHLDRAAGTDLRDIRSGALEEAITQGDKAIAQIIERAADVLGIAVANLVHLLAPDVVILGGGLVEAMPQRWVSRVQRVAGNRVMESFTDSFAVKAAKLGDDAAVMGAAAWVEADLARRNSGGSSPPPLN